MAGFGARLLVELAGRYVPRRRRDARARLVREVAGVAERAWVEGARAGVEAVRAGRAVGPSPYEGVAEDAVDRVLGERVRAEVRCARRALPVRRQDGMEPCNGYE